MAGLFTFQTGLTLTLHYPGNLSGGITVDPSGMGSLNCQQGVV